MSGTLSKIAVVLSFDVAMERSILIKLTEL